MKKAFVLILTICLLLIFTNGCSPQTNSNHISQNPEAKIAFLQYTWDGWGVSVKYLGDCDAADRIIMALDSMKETGETVKKISNDVLAIGSVSRHLPVERGTLWLEIGDKIYRLTPDLSQICLVETHFGEGKVLAITDEFKTDVNNARHYAPYDYYLGTYNSGDDTVELNNVFKSDSSVKLRITDIKVECEYDPQNIITVELISTTDQEVTIELSCQQSSDNLALGSSKTMTLKKDIPTTVELTFGGWPDSRYWISLAVENTRAEITINP